MNSTITIGLTYTGTEEKHNYYVNWMKNNDDTIEVVKLSADNTTGGDFDTLNALVLSGGVDVHPKFYNNSIVNYNNAPEIFNEARDEFEINTFNICLKRNIPILGICRGMQLINCIMGGTLHQDIESHTNNGFDVQHNVQIKEETLLHKICNVDEAIANSVHHQSINRLGEGLIVNAVAPDNVIEGIEWKEKTNKPFMLAVQWHPERMFKLNMEDAILAKDIRQGFLTAIKN